MKRSTLYILITGTVFVLLALVLVFAPRPKYSEIEKRDLVEVPELNGKNLMDGSVTNGISSWFSDTVPFRDKLLQGALWLRGKAGLAFRKKHAEEPVADTLPAAPELPLEELVGENDTIRNYTPAPAPDESFKMAGRGIIIRGKAPGARALMGFFAKETYGKGFADIMNLYHKTFGDSVTIYCMPIPMCIEYYLPEGISAKVRKQGPFIKHIFDNLDEGVKPVNIYNVLAGHVDEPIYLRTDHHWSPLGAYYAAKKFAAVAGVPFKDLSHYQSDTVHRFVGTMYMYSKDIAVKQSAEDFVWYEPKDTTYTVSCIQYSLNKDFKITGEGREGPGKFFHRHKDGSSGAYSTFMGGDALICKVRTQVGNGRRLIILKDSFGNAIPGYLFYSFEEVHVIDSRYFTKNMVKYVRDNKITDILFANNTASACADFILNDYRRFLTQTSFTYSSKEAPASTAKPEAAAIPEPAAAPEKAEEPAAAAPAEKPAESPSESPSE